MVFVVFLRLSLVLNNAARQNEIRKCGAMGNDRLSEQEMFSNFLKTKGLSSTRQRKIILDEVFRNHTHFEADEIVETLRKKMLRVSRATVYRTLAHLDACNLIRKVDLGHGHSHYEHTYGHRHHEHLYCNRCGNLMEFNDPALENRIENIAESHGFVISNHAVQIFGTCKKCSEQGKES